MSFYVLLIRRELLLESSIRIETNPDVVVEVLEFQINVALELCLDD